MPSAPNLAAGGGEDETLVALVGRMAHGADGAVAVLARLLSAVMREHKDDPQISEKTQPAQS